MEPLLDEEWMGLIVPDCGGGWRIWPLAPWQLVNAVSMAVAVRFFSLLLLCCRMGSRGDGSDVVDGMQSSAPPLARDGLGYHGHDNGSAVADVVTSHVIST